MKLDMLEYRLLEIIYSQGGISNFKLVTDAFQKEVSLKMTEWSLTSNLEPRWKSEIRKCFHSLNDLDLVTGSELGEWHLTKLGIEVLQLRSSESDKAKRYLDSSFRIIRDTKISNQLKQIYNYKCQVCGQSIFLGSNSFYAEGHHLMPLGEPHNGPDIKDNIIILCPNHHVAFDYSTMAVNPNTMLIEFYSETSNELSVVGPLYQNLHNFNMHCLKYHYYLFCKQCTN